MSPPPIYFNPTLGGVCLTDGTYAYVNVGGGLDFVQPHSLDGHMISYLGNESLLFSVDPRFMASVPGMGPLFARDPIPENRWDARRRTVLQELAQPFPPSQYETRERLIRRLEAEGLHEGNAREIGQELESIGLRIPRPPRQAAVTVASEPPLPRLSAEMEREAVRALGGTRSLRNVSEALPEIVEVYRFDRTRKIRSPEPLSGSAYSPLDRALIVVDGNPGGTFSIDAMNQEQWDAFRSDVTQRAYAVTNPRADGTLRTDARTLEYHIIADAIDPATLRYFRETNPYVRVVRYGSAADVSAGRGEVLIDSPRQYLRSELMEEGTLHETGDFVEVRRGDEVIRRLPRAQVTGAFYHYLGRLSPERAAQVTAWTESRGLNLSELTREQGAELLHHLQSREGGWTVEDVHALIGSEGMRSYFGYGIERPFGFETTDAFRGFRADVLTSLDQAGLPVRSGEARVILSGSAMSGFASKGGQFRWSETTDALGNVRAPSDYDIKVVVPPEVFDRWVEASIAAQPTERLRKALRHYIPGVEGIRWAELPPAFREALEPLRARYPRIQQVTIALEGGYWHIQDPMADSLRYELTDTSRGGGGGPRLIADTTMLSQSAPRVVSDTMAESVLMARDAAPVDTLNREVIKAQIVLTYREYYMSQAGRDALLRNEPLPTGDALINSDYTSDVNAMANAIINEYGRRRGTTGLTALWDAQRARGFLPRGGVPEGLVTELCGERIAREHREGLSRYSGTFTPDAFSREATERLSNTDSFRRGLIEALREPARIGR